MRPGAGNLRLSLFAALFFTLGVRADGPKPSAPEATVVCPRCHGSATVACSSPGCHNGWKDCPGPCLKLDVGVWEHMEVAGHSPDDVWQKFPARTERWHAWNQSHVGHVILYRDGDPYDSGPCAICGGTGRVKCTVCYGTGRVACPLCKGSGRVFASVANGPQPGDPPAAMLMKFHLRDGTVLEGRIVAQTPAVLIIKKTDGKTVRVIRSDVLPDAGGN